ncbi:MAG: DUF1330 domain-containing protein [Pseudomonadota bacterium]
MSRRLRTLLVTRIGPLIVAMMATPGFAESAPAYMLVLGDVHDRDAFREHYAAKLPPLYEKYGGEYVAIGRGVEVLEGDYSPESFVVARWPSMEAARKFWNSPEYAVLKDARIRGRWGTFDVLLVPALPSSATAAPILDEAPD